MNVLISACLLGVACRYDGASRPLDTLPLDVKGIHFIPVCPEILGGLSTPRIPAERVDDRVLRQDGIDVTPEYRRGAEETLRLARLFACQYAVLKERSPSCGSGNIYDGSFGGVLKDGDGVTTELLKFHGITVLGESDLPAFLQQFRGMKDED